VPERLQDKADQGGREAHGEGATLPAPAAATSCFAGPPSDEMEASAVTMSCTQTVYELS
jgi:hypothetical protein